MGLGRKREDDPNIPTYIRKWHGAILSAGLGWVVAEAGGEIKRARDKIKHYDPV